MKRIKAVLFCLLSVTLHAQINEHFSDGDFTSNPVWTGDSAHWRISGGMLSSNASATASSTYLATRSLINVNAEWEFLINLKFLTSSVNYTDFFLLSDSSNLSGNNDGYFVRIGNTTDEISLYRKDGNASVEIIDGADNRVGSSNNIFKIKISRDKNFRFTLWNDNSGTGSSYFTEGSCVDSTYKASGWLGVLIHYSASNIQKFFFDDITADTIRPDTMPPSIDTVYALDSASVLVRLNEIPDSSLSCDPGNYLLNGIEKPIKAVLNSNDIVLQFKKPLERNSVNNITVFKLGDRKGNITSKPISSVFRYNAVRKYDLVINEIFADPSPVIGLPPYEYIELWNVSGKTLFLAALTLSDESSIANLPAVYLKPDSFIIFCSPAAAQSFVPGTPAFGVNGFPGLNNDGDHIKLKDENGNTIDDINYTLSWYNDKIKSQGGYALELVRPGMECLGKFAWKASDNLTGGTPGFVNSVFNEYADTIHPVVSHAAFQNDSVLLLIFNSPMDTGKALVTSSSLKIKKTIFSGLYFDSLRIELEDKMLDQHEYLFNVSGVKNCLGQSLQTETFSFFYDEPRAPLMRELIVSEIMSDPDPPLKMPASEYIELYNRSGHTISLDGLIVTDGSSVAHLPAYNIRNDSFLVLCPVGSVNDFAKMGICCIGIYSFPNLDNIKDKILIKDSSGKTISAAYYDISKTGDMLHSKGGFSLERIDDSKPCQDIVNWAFTKDQNGGTPGKLNSIRGIIASYQPKVTRIYTLDPAHLILEFDGQVDSVSAGGQGIRFEPDIAGDVLLSYDLNRLNRLKVELKDSLRKGVVYSVFISGIGNCTGQAMTEAVMKAGVAEMAEPGDLVINEMLCDAKAYESEFIEIFNRSQKIIGLNQLSMEIADKNGGMEIIRLTDQPLQIFPGEYYALCPDRSAMLKKYKSTDPGKIMEASSWKSMDDDSGGAFLINFYDGKIIDSALYSSKMHHPYLTDIEGVSLERVDETIAGSETSNWQSASGASGYATPAAENSKHKAPGLNEDFISIDHPWFSPDNDGYRDDLTIHLSLDSKPYSISITVFDLNGNIVRNLARNEIAGVNNLFKWKGEDESGNVVPTGHYILLVQLMDGQGTSRYMKKVCDVIMP
jgi:hypothetical protein